jgi:hypothetical protein
MPGLVTLSSDELKNVKIMDHTILARSGFSPVLIVDLQPDPMILSDDHIALRGDSSKISAVQDCSHFPFTETCNVPHTKTMDTSNVHLDVVLSRLVVEFEELLVVAHSFSPSISRIDT